MNKPSNKDLDAAVRVIARAHDTEDQYYIMPFGNGGLSLKSASLIQNFEKARNPVADVSSVRACASFLAESFKAGQMSMADLNRLDHLSFEEGFRFAPVFHQDNANHESVHEKMEGLRAVRYIVASLKKDGLGAISADMREEFHDRLCGSNKYAAYGGSQQQHPKWANCGLAKAA